VTIDDVRTEVDRLRAERRRFVAATVVRAEKPTSARAGDRAVVLDDGTILGFVGGECARASVQLHALQALDAGEPRLLRITPDSPAGPTPGAPEEAAELHDGAVTVHNPCLSGGSLEIFLEPEAPPGVAVVHGDGPIARAVAELAEWLGFIAQPWSPGSLGSSAPGVVAVVAASHGGDERTVLEEALRAQVPYIGLVASRRRAAAVLPTLDVDAAARARVHTPAGLDIGSRSPREVALSILSQLVATRPRPLSPDAISSAAPPTAAAGAAGEVAPAAVAAVDPVCGMAVAAVGPSRQADHNGTRYWFCGQGCEGAFRSDPAAFQR
jgi:xanthine dehydrogenase accessory factor